MFKLLYILLYADCTSRIGLVRWLVNVSAKPFGPLKQVKHVKMTNTVDTGSVWCFGQPVEKRRVFPLKFFNCLYIKSLIRLNENCLVYCNYLFLCFISVSTEQFHFI